jgi:hypothetical protein
MRRTRTRSALGVFLVENWELIAASLSILVLTTAYLIATRLTATEAGVSANHGLGILGFLLMVATETLYSWRKTRHDARWGRTRVWLKAHIFGGIVGPYMVFLHTGFHFAGLAGVTFWMTVAVMCSGFVGRYIHTAIPRTAPGYELNVDQLEAAIRDIEARLQAWAWRSAHPTQRRALSEAIEAMPAAGEAPFRALRSKGGAPRLTVEPWQQAIERLEAPIREQVRTLGILLDSRRALQRHGMGAAPARRLLAVWHAVHVPLAIATFAAAVLHMIAALTLS